MLSERSGGRRGIRSLRSYLEKKKDQVQTREGVAAQLDTDADIARRRLEESLMSGTRQAIFDKVLSKVGGPADIYQSRMETSSQLFRSFSPSKSLFPANIVFEGHD